MALRGCCGYRGHCGIVMRLWNSTVLPRYVLYKEIEFKSLFIMPEEPGPWEPDEQAVAYDLLDAYTSCLLGALRDR